MISAINITSETNNKLEKNQENKLVNDMIDKINRASLRLSISPLYFSCARFYTGST